MTLCPICCDDKIHTVLCGACDDTCCRECAQTYIIDKVGGGDVASCMFCKTEYNEDIMFRYFTKSWRLGPLKKVREKALEDIERSKYEMRYERFLEYVQPEARYHLRGIVYHLRWIAEKIAGKVDRFENLKNAWGAFERRWEKWIHACEDEDDIESLRTIKKTVQELLNKREHCEIYKNLNNFTNTLSYSMTRRHFRGGSTKIKKKKFNRPCPASNCFGMLDKSSTCGTCFTAFCGKCLIEVSDDTAHECDPDLVSTVSLMAETSVPCPKCQTYVTKSEGCDLMWCTLCHQTFDYSTGHMVAGRNHNPMYYEWLRRDGHTPPREIGDEIHDPCAETPEAILAGTGGSEEDCRVAHAICQLVLEIRTRYLPRMHSWYASDNSEAHEDAAYYLVFRDTMLGYIKQEQYGFHLQKVEKDFRKKRYFRSIADTFAMVALESIQNWHRSGRKGVDVQGQISEAVTFFNAQFRNVGDALNNRFPIIHWENEKRLTIKRAVQEVRP